MTVLPPMITALYGALNALLNIFLAYRVSTLRRKHGVSIGAGEDELLIAGRTHGNNAEFVPLAIVVMLLAELCGGDTVVLHVYGGTLFLARIAHAIGMPMKAPNAPRFLGVVLTWLAIVSMSGYILFLRFR